MFRCSLAALAFVLGTAATAGAAPILISTTLTGDPRPNNPDNLRVNVSVTGDTTWNYTLWNIDLDMQAFHPNARLDEFGFNLRGLASDYSFVFTNLPYVQTTGTLNGSGSTTFLLTLDDPNGNQNDATNITSLQFRVERTTGTFSLDDFRLAPTSCSSDALLGCNQLGAHLQALNGGEGSGVATGNYDVPPVNSVPEPGSLLLLACGLAVGVRFRRQ